MVTAAPAPGRASLRVVVVVSMADAVVLWVVMAFSVVVDM
jgi:hypothetical protein